MSYPRAVAIYNRHSGPVDSRTKPTDFVARMMAPIIEEAMECGCKIHVIHDQIAYPNGIENLGMRFDEETKIPKVMREWKTIERSWRMKIKSSFEELDIGILETFPGQTILPEMSLIRDINKAVPRKILNHVNFHDIGAVKEFAFFAVLHHLVRRNGEEPFLYKDLRRKYLDDQSEEMDQFNVSLWLMKMGIDALASSTMLRDAELAKQVRMIRDKHPHDIIVIPRNLKHKNMGGLFSETGISLEEKFDLWLNDFSDDAIMHMNSSVEVSDIEVLWSAFLNYCFLTRIAGRDFNNDEDRRDSKIGALDSFIGFLDGSGGGGFRDGSERIGLNAVSRDLVARSFPYPIQETDPPRLLNVLSGT